MADLAANRPPARFPLRAQLGLGMAFIERQTNLWKRHWAWEVVWLFYGVVNTLAIGFIAKQLGADGVVAGEAASDLVLFLLIGTLVWAYLSAVLDDISLVVTWERWEGTIEHTLMAPVPRVAHLIGTAAFGVIHGLLRTALIMAISLPFFDVDLSGANWGAAAVVVLVGSFSLLGLGILAGVLPLVYPERGEQLSFMVQAAVLLVSGVYYSVETLPAVLRLASWLSPATYLLRSVRAALIDGRGVLASGGDLAVMAVFAVVLIPLSVAVFSAGERWAKRTGRLKRQG
ncbi:MAG: ABC transporter permease [Acidimicrobiales bacterium]